MNGQINVMGSIIFN